MLGLVDYASSDEETEAAEATTQPQQHPLAAAKKKKREGGVVQFTVPLTVDDMSSSAAVEADEAERSTYNAEFASIVV